MNVERPKGHDNSLIFDFQKYSHFKYKYIKSSKDEDTEKTTKIILNETETAILITKMLDYIANVSIQKKMWNICSKLSNEVWALNNNLSLFHHTKDKIKQLLTENYKLIEFVPFDEGKDRKKQMKINYDLFK